nr:zinc finger, CCHC-type [Tanacetum cinerariifolium]
SLGERPEEAWCCSGFTNAKVDILSKLASVAFHRLKKVVLVKVLTMRLTEGNEMDAIVDEKRDTWMTSIIKCFEEGVWSEDLNESRNLQMATNQTTNNNLIRSIIDKEKLNGSNFLDWYRNLRIVLKNEQKLHHLKEALPEAPLANATVVVRNAYTRRVAEQQQVACPMLVSRDPKELGGPHHI